MKIAFVSNFLNHHQLPFSLAMQGKDGVEYAFVATKEISKERATLGYQNMNREFDFVIRAYESEEQQARAVSVCNEADVVIIGSAPWEYVVARLAQNRTTFLYSERIYKKRVQYYKLPLRLLRHWKKFGRHKNLHLLCASAYTAGDYARTRTFLGKAYKWGYFPEVKRYEDIPSLLANKQKNSILWAGRFLGWKHPEVPIEIAKRLVADGYDFELDMIGVGEEFEKTRALSVAEGLSDRVHFHGSMKPEEVREYMEKSEIYLFTSDRGEGWGAVLNESMNSGCAVVASHAIGSVPFLVKDGENGLIYQDGNIDDLYKKVKWLLDHSAERARMGEAAYRTMTEEWNAENAAKRFLALAEAILEGNTHPTLFAEGVCSKAETRVNFVF